MAVILSIETATRICSVALHADEQWMALAELNVENAHSRALTRLIEQVLANGGYALSAVDAIAVSKGPGSYTGLRIGTATAKGLCYASDKPLIAVHTLEALAHGVRTRYPETTEYGFCPMIDARRMEVYCAVYDRNGNSILPVDARIIDAHSFSDTLQNQPVLFFGDGAAKCQLVLSASPNAVFLSGITPSATDVGVLATEKFRQKAFEDVAYFEPFYLKEFFFKSR